MAFKTEIQIGVKGAAQLDKLSRKVAVLNQEINRVNSVFSRGVQSLERYSLVSQKAANNLQRVKQTVDAAGNATGRYKAAINQLVSARMAENKIQEKTNRLIEKETLLRERASRMAKIPKAVATPNQFPRFRKPVGPQPAGKKERLEQIGQFGLGTGFPLLFGGGAGQVAGGAIGTALSGALGVAGSAAMGFQIALSAALGKVEEMVTRFREVGNAIKSLDMDRLANTFITVNAATRDLVRNLVEAGEGQRAVAVAANETFQQTGVLPEAVDDITNNVNLLSNVWDEVVGTVSGLLSILAAPFLTVLSAILKLAALIFKGINIIASGVGIVVKRVGELILKIPLIQPLLNLIQNATKGIVEEEENALAALRETVDVMDREFKSTEKLHKLEMQRTAGRTAAEKLINAELDKSIALKKIDEEAEARKLELRKKFGHLTTHQAQVDREFAELQIDREADRQKQLVQHKHTFVAQNIELERQKEILEEKIKKHKMIQGALDAQMVTLSAQTEIFKMQAKTTDQAFSVAKARNDAEMSFLKLTESRLARSLDRLKKLNGGFATQKVIINQIADVKEKQARLEFKNTQAQIKQMLARAEVERQSVEFQVQRIRLQIEMLNLQAQEIEDTKKRAEALARINAERKVALDISKQMIISADATLGTTKEIAKFQQISANNLLKGKLESIESERLEARRAVHSAAIARSHQQAAAAVRQKSEFEKKFALGAKTTHTVTTQGPIDPEVKKRVIGRGGFRSVEALVSALDKEQRRVNSNKRPTALAKGGHVTGAQLALIGEQGPEYVVPEKKAAAFATNYLMGARGAAAIPRFADGGYTGPINIQTGPVMQQEGRNFVSVDQFEKGLLDLASAMSSSSRSFGGRSYMGVR